MENIRKRSEQEWFRWKCGAIRLFVNFILY